MFSSANRCNWLGLKLSTVMGDVLKYPRRFFNRLLRAGGTLKDSIDSVPRLIRLCLDEHASAKIGQEKVFPVQDREIGGKQC